MFEFDWSMFEEMYGRNNKGKYKIGQVVRYKGGEASKINLELAGYIGKTFEVRAANYGDEWEYLLAGFPFLVWEEEIESLEEEKNNDQ